MIGIFDSGVGGLGIYKEVRKLLLNESIIYLTDNKNCPYGEKSDKEIKKIALENTKFLIDKGCNIVVIACNTASTIALEYVRKTLSSYTSATPEVAEVIPIVGVVPVMKTAAKVSKNKRIGILATKKTVESKYLHNLVEQFCPSYVKTTEGKPRKKVFKVFYQEANELVALVEKSEIRNSKSETNSNFQNSKFQTVCHSERPKEVEESSEAHNNDLRSRFFVGIQNDKIKIIKKYLNKFIKAKVDVVALGCTHFPFLRSEIEKIMGPRVKILDSNGAVARQVARIATNLQPTTNNKQPEYQFYTSGNPMKVRSVMENLLGKKVDWIRKI